MSENRKPTQKMMVNHRIIIVRMPKLGVDLIFSDTPSLMDFRDIGQNMVIWSETNLGWVINYRKTRFLALNPVSLHCSLQLIQLMRSTCVIIYIHTWTDRPAAKQVRSANVRSTAHLFNTADGCGSKPCWCCVNDLRVYSLVLLGHWWQLISFS